MKRLFFWKVDVRRLERMRPKDIYDSEKWSERAQLDAMPEQWLRPRPVEFTTHRWIIAHKDLTPVVGSLWQREARLQ